MTVDTLESMALELGFSHVYGLNTEALKFLPEVREMCASGKCRKYGACWSCPPYCGSLEDISKRARVYHAGLLLQSTADMEDDFDYDTIEATQTMHKERFNKLVLRLKSNGTDFFPMSSGACTLCQKCSCPDSPCRHPELSAPSMEACGLVVSDVCRDSGALYYYGPKTITYTACILL